MAAYGNTEAFKITHAEGFAARHDKPGDTALFPLNERPAGKEHALPHGWLR